MYLLFRPCNEERIIDLLKVCIMLIVLELTLELAFIFQGDCACAIK